MQVQELQTILEYADIQKDQKVQVRIAKGNRITSVEIGSFNVYADAVVLQVEVNEEL